MKNMPAIKMIRFVNTGSEANSFAMRVARAYQKKSKIANLKITFKANMIMNLYILLD